MFFVWNQSINSFILMSEMNLWCLIIKKIEIIIWIRVYPNWKMNFNSKNGGKGSFCYETNVSISLTQRGECVYASYSWTQGRLLCEFMLFLIDRWTLIPKNMGSEAFLWNQSINSFILMSGKNLWCPIVKRNEIIMWIYVYPY